MAGAGDVLLDPLREAVGLRAIPSAAEDVQIVPGELGERAELLGAVALVLHRKSGALGDANGVKPVPRGAGQRRRSNNQRQQARRRTG
jgi:hypothetical protein